MAQYDRNFQKYKRNQNFFWKKWWLNHNTRGSELIVQKKRSKLTYDKYNMIRKTSLRRDCFNTVCYWNNVTDLFVTMQIWLKNWVLKFKSCKNAILAYKLLLKEFFWGHVTELSVICFLFVISSLNPVKKHVFPSYTQKCGFLRLCRDVVEFLEENGFIVQMPEFKGKRLQLTSVEANYSRFVTKTRFVVEVVHGHLQQQFKLLSSKLDNKILPKTASLYKVAAFLHNHFGKHLPSDNEISKYVVNYTKSRRDLEDNLSI